MKTIFDTLNNPQFRERAAMFIGRQDLYTMETWINGYRSSCEDAGEENRLNTLNGLSISLLRDYLAWKEQDHSTGGIAYIMMNAANGSEEDAWKRFFSRLDEFESLKIQNTWRLTITEPMAKHTANQKQVFTLNASEDMIPLSFLGCVITKTNLSDGLCWVKTEYADRESSSLGFAGLEYAILSEIEFDARMAGWFGTVHWELIS